MNKLIFSSLLVVAATLSLNSCSKYDEGSKFTVLTKKARLVNQWKVSSITANGTDVTDLNIITEIDIQKNGKIFTSSNFLGIPTTTEGTWVFDNDKSHVLVSNGEELEDYEIIKLKNNELKVQSVSDNVLYVQEYVSK